jgi:hypothetical protein
MFGFQRLDASTTRRLDVDRLDSTVTPLVYGHDSDYDSVYDYVQVQVQVHVHESIAAFVGILQGLG